MSKIFIIACFMFNKKDKGWMQVLKEIFGSEFGSDSTNENGKEQGRNREEEERRKKEEEEEARRKQERQRS